MKVFHLFLLLSTFVFSQNQHSKNFLGKTEYFHNLPQEKFYLHTNKTTYFTGETLWWKAYVVSDFTDKPTLTTNLYVNFYNSNKELISHKLFYCEKGMAFGEIEIDNTLQAGTYYIQLDTNWSQNFTNKYIQAIQIINSESKDNLAKSIEQKKEDLNLSFYPESGSILYNTVNWVYLSLENNGNFIPEQPIKIIDKNDNRVVAKAKTNKNGHAKFSLIYKPKGKYAASVNYNNQNYTFDMNPSKVSGVIIHKKHSKNNNDKEAFTVEFSTDLLKSYNDKTFFATIHRNNKLLYVLPFKVNKKDSKYLLAFSKENMFNGFNSFTLFDAENRPVAERSFYTETKPNTDLIVKKIEQANDSINLDFYSKNTSGITNVSISVLPKNTRVNSDANTIYDAFLLKPYVKNSIPTISKLSREELDMVLQTQINPIKKHHINRDQPLFKPEVGLSINGSVNAKIEENYKVLLSSKESGILEVVNVGQDKRFAFSNLILKDKGDYRLALLDEKGQIIKAGFYVYKQNKNYKVDSLLIYEKLVKANVEKEITKNKMDSFIEYKGIQKLKEVVIETQIEKEKETLYPYTQGELGSGFNKTLRISEVEGLTLTVLQYLDRQVNISAKEGWLIGTESDSTLTASFSRIRFTRGSRSFHGPNDGPLILLDNFRVDSDVLYQMRLSEVASIKVNASGAGYGMMGARGVILINLKDGRELSKNLKVNHNYFKSETDFGFTPSISIFKNNLIKFSSLESKRFYETLDWIPYFNVESDKTNTLKIYHGDHDEIKLFINGMNEYGDLFYDIIEINTKEKL